MLKQLIIYGISTGINRGTVIIYLPFLLNVLGTSEYGIYSLIVIASNLLIPFVCLNGSSAILREGSEDVKKGLYLLEKFFLITSIIVILLGILVYFFFSFEWMLFVIILAGLEALHQLYLTYLRCNNKSWTYLTIVIVKVFGLLIIFWLLQKEDINLYQLLQVQLYWYLIIFSYMIYSMILWKFVFKEGSKKISLFDVLPYTLLLIPHGISQWVVSSSDRFIISEILGTYELGIYSIAYSLAMVLMLVNSGIALALPTHFIKNYEHWTTGEIRKKAINLYNFGTILLFLCLIIFVYIDFRYLNSLDNHESIGFTLTFTWIGLYFLGLYLFYTNYLYYHKKSGVLAKQTIIVAILNVFLTIILTLQIGIVGAALATLLSYFIYFILILYAVSKIEKRILEKFSKELKLVPMVVLVCCLLGYIYSILIH